MVLSRIDKIKEVVPTLVEGCKENKEVATNGHRGHCRFDGYTVTARFGSYIIVADKTHRILEISLSYETLWTFDANAWDPFYKELIKDLI